MPYTVSAYASEQDIAEECHRQPGLLAAVLNLTAALDEREGDWLARVAVELSPYGRALLARLAETAKENAP
ncbi:MAG: hypothetical protein KGL46_03860 [Hyphomicrobiales bacterium]|nr:hypothetical protein [Hyphomicrobiales bacterium]